MDFYLLALGILAVWRITHFFNAEDGPWDISVRLRRLAGGGFWGKLLDCFYCLSIWIAAPFAGWLGDTWGERFLLWLSMSAGACLLERITNREKKIPFAPYLEDKEK
jgi:MFS family permease